MKHIYCQNKLDFSYLKELLKKKTLEKHKCNVVAAFSTPSEPENW